jgi:tRNA dimethylallyltransferase
MKHVVAVVGPTGVGKSALTLRLAQDFQGEIISADSRQIYRNLDIGTAKPTTAEQSLAPHHLIDIVNPDETFSLAQYRELVYRTVDKIVLKGHLPLIVGGSGLYVWAVLEGWQIPPVAPDFNLRKRLEARATRGEKENLYEELKQIDAKAAGRIDPHNIRRVIRALEISYNLGLSPKPTKTGTPFDNFIIGLTAKRETLYQRIDERVESMVSRGLVEEVRKLTAEGYGLDLPSMSGIGYRQIRAFLEGTVSLDEAVQQVKNESHRLVRQQYNWFKLKDDRIHWFDVDIAPYTEIKILVTKLLKA